jgi:hypothetical protein
LFGAVDGDIGPGRQQYQGVEAMVPPSPVRTSDDNSVGSRGRQTTPSRAMQPRPSPNSDRAEGSVRSQSPQSMRDSLLNPAVLKTFYETFRAIIFPASSRGESGALPVSGAHVSLAKKAIER